MVRSKKKVAAFTTAIGPTYTCPSGASQKDASMNSPAGWMPWSFHHNAASSGANLADFGMLWGNSSLIKTVDIEGWCQILTSVA